MGVQGYLVCDPFRMKNNHEENFDHKLPGPTKRIQGRALIVQIWVELFSHCLTNMNQMRNKIAVGNENWCNE